jgi:hypothetical protein
MLSGWRVGGWTALRGLGQPRIVLDDLGTCPWTLDLAPTAPQPLMSTTFSPSGDFPHNLPTMTRHTVGEPGASALTATLASVLQHLLLQSRYLGIDCSVLMGANIARDIGHEELSGAVIGYTNPQASAGGGSGAGVWWGMPCAQGMGGVRDWMHQSSGLGLAQGDGTHTMQQAGVGEAIGRAASVRGGYKHGAWGMPHVP